MSKKGKDSEKSHSKDDTIEINLSRKSLGLIAAAIFIFAAGFFAAGLLGGDSLSLGMRSRDDSLETETMLLEDDAVTVYFFWGEGCPYCERQKPYVEDWIEQYPNVEILDFDAWSNPEYSTLFRDVASAHGLSAGGVPTTFIGDEYWVGFDPSWAEEMEAKIESCLSEGCDDPARDVLQSFLGGGGEQVVDIEIPTVSLTVLDDETCPVCETWDIVASLEDLMGSLEIRTVDISSSEGKEMVEAFEVKSVPAYLFDSGVTAHPSYTQLQMYLDSKDDAYLLRAGGDSKLIEREASTEPTIGLFSMSMCPYGTMAGTYIAEIIGHFDGDLKFDLYFIATEYPEGFDSMRGQPEIDEDIRQLCVFEHEYEKLSAYLVCINEDISQAGELWSSCAENAGIDPATISDCVESGQGEELLRENIKIAEELEIGGSPTFLINNQILASGLRPPEALVGMICDSNPELDGCEAAFDTASDASVPTGSC